MASVPHQPPELEAEWRLFEEKVVLLFRSAGYIVTPKTELLGFEFDLLVVAPGPFGSSIKLAVECKCHEKKLVGNTEIHGFITAFRANSPPLNISLGIIVTNTGFSRQAHEASSQDSRIKLLRIQELEEYLLGLESYLDAVSNNYTSLKGARGYMVLSGERYEEQTLGYERIDDLAAHLQTKFINSDQYFAFVLGDFGSGKTTLAEKLHLALSRNYISKTTDKIPFIFYLKTLAQFETESAFVAAQILPFSSNLRFEAIQRLAKQREIVLILDGFDEVATHATEVQRLGLFSRVMNLTQISKKLLITSRPSYFGNIREINALVATLRDRDQSVAYRFKKKPRRAERDSAEIFAQALARVREKYIGSEYRLFPVEASDIFFVRPLSREQVIEYFTLFQSEIWNRQKKTPTEVYEILTSVYDLSDLMSRPLLLTMFSEVLLEPEFNLDEIESSIGAAEIYIRYINIHLDRDWQKGPQRQFLTREERLQFARAAALTMYKSGGALEANYESILKIVSEIVGSKADYWKLSPADLSIQRDKFTTENLPAVVNDIRVCSFLNITSADQIQFSHKSFMEFFFADIIISQLPSGEFIELLDSELSYEILYFIGSFCLVRSDYRVDILFQIANVAPRATEQYEINLKLALVFSEQISTDQKFERIEKERIKVRKKKFFGCSFSDVVLDRINIMETDFVSCRFVRSLLSGEFSNVVFEEFFGRLELEGQITNSKISGPPTAVDEEPQSGVYTRSVVIDGHVDNVEFEYMRIECDGDVAFKNVRIEDSGLHFVRTPSVSFEASQCLRTRVGNWSINWTLEQPATFSGEGCIFRSCEFCAVAFDARTVATLLKTDALRDCWGLICVDQTISPFYLFRRDKSGGRRSEWAVANGCVFVDAKADQDKIEELRECLVLRPNSEELEEFLQELFEF